MICLKNKNKPTPMFFTNVNAVEAANTTSNKTNDNSNTSKDSKTTDDKKDEDSKAENSASGALGMIVAALGLMSAL